MKWIKRILALLLLLGVGLVGGSLLLPASTHVERSIVIDRPVAQVFATLNSFQRFNRWSPWAGIDPATKYSYAGPAMGAGARMSWQGNPAMGSGSQEILESVHNQRVVVALVFEGSAARAIYVLTPEDSGTRVSWSFDSQHGYNPLARWFGLLFNRMIGPDYEKGLRQLKQLLELDPPDAG